MEEQAASTDELTQLLVKAGIQQPEPSAEEKDTYLHRYSIGALVLSVFYYWAMGDILFALLSVFCSIVFIFTPVLFIMPIWARQRAYQAKSYSSFRDFQQAQQRWDRSALYSSILLVATLLVSVFVIGPMLINSLQQINPDLFNGSTNKSTLQQLQQTQQDLQNLTQ